MPDFTAMSMWMNAAIFCGAGVAVWFAGVRITDRADEISRKTGIGQAVIGLILLAGVTSLPEIGATVTAGIRGNAQLATNNLFGSIALQAALLAVVDFAIGRKALTAALPEPALMFMGALNVILLAFAASGILVGDYPVLGIGIWAWGCAFLYVGSVWLLSRERGRKPWLAASKGKVDERLIQQAHEQEQETNEKGEGGLRKLLLRTGMLAAIILFAGFLLAETGDALASQTGLGSSFAGFVLLAMVTSLPELSTSLTAARKGLLTMAISDILGTNLINIGLIFVVDLVGTGAPALAQAGRFGAFGALLAIAITTIFVAGLAERRNTTVGRLGLDSIVVIMVYAGGLVLLYSIRGQQ
jgi:cation:H+ antiporter